MAEKLFKTKLEALIACRNHWQFLEITESCYKRDYTPAISWILGCAACEWDSYFNNACENCMLSGYAWGDSCNDPPSFWCNWTESTSTKQAKFYANRMVYACNQAIEDYLLNDKED